MSDYISCLPDSVLAKILSLLQTKEAFATTILSRRWKNLFYSVTALRFEGKIEDSDSNLKFLDFLYSHMMVRDSSLPVTDFIFHMIYGVVPFPIASLNKILRVVVQRKVEHLSLQFSTTRWPKLPKMVLCKTLVELKLSCFHIENNLGRLQMPCLKTLVLVSCCFEELEDCKVFLSGCPVLESLVVENIWYKDSFFAEKNLNTLLSTWSNFSLNRLTEANIDDCSSYFPLIIVNNVTSLRLILKEIHYYAAFTPIFHNLTKMKLICKEDYTMELLLNLLYHCPRLQWLQVGDKLGMDELGETDLVLPDTVLQCCELHLKKCFIISFLGMDGKLMLAKYLLKNAKVLEMMQVWTDEDAIKDIVSSFPRASPTCELTFNQ